MVSTQHAPYISPSDIARVLQIHPSAPVRWMRHGTLLADGSRVRLQHLRLPGGFRTTQEWLDVFLRAVADGRSAKPDETAKPSPKAPRVAMMRAGLAENGF